MNKIQWQLYRIAERLGVMGYIAIGLMVLALGLYLMLLRPLVVALHEAENDQQQPTQQHSVEKTDAEMLHDFLEALPPVSQRSAAVDALIEIAKREGLEPNEIAYKTAVRSDDPVSHYHVEFRLYAAYADIQHFLSVLLHQLNYVSIESLKFSRESVKDDAVEAHIHLAFHFNQR